MQSGAKGKQVKEAAKINQSLCALGSVINKLVGKSTHVPYQASKLTHVLQDSFGGNSKTTVTVTVNLSSCHAAQTLATLKFAQKAELICNTVDKLQQLVEKLKVEGVAKEDSLPCSFKAFELDDFNSVCGSSDSGGDAMELLVSPQVSSTKAIVAGALRREQAAEFTKKRLTTHIEEANRLMKKKKVLKGFNISNFLQYPPSVERVRVVQSPNSSFEMDSFQSSVEVKVKVKVERMPSFGLDPSLLPFEVGRMDSFSPCCSLPPFEVEGTHYVVVDLAKKNLVSSRKKKKKKI